MENELPFRTGASVARAGFADHDNAPARTSAGIRPDDDFSFHVRVDRAQVVIVTRSCKSERELGVLDDSFRSKPLVHVHDSVGHVFFVDPGHRGAWHNSDFAGNESVMVHAHGSHGAGAGIVRVFRKAGRGRQSGEQEGHSQSTTDTLRLADAQPEGCCICGEVLGVTDCQNNLLLVSFEAICPSEAAKLPE